MEIQSALIIAGMILIIYYLCNYMYFGKEAISASDGMKYYVVDGYENKEGAAELLSKVNHNVMLFLKYLKIKYRVNYTEGAEMYREEAMNAIVEEFSNKRNVGATNTLTGNIETLTSPLKKSITSFTDAVKSMVTSIPLEGFGDNHKHGANIKNHYTRMMIAETLVNNNSGNLSATASEFSNKAVNRLLTGYDLENIMENDPKASGDNTYTVDKGAKMVICLRDRKSFKLHDENIVMFVVLHELAHIANEQWGHSSESQFWEIFKFLLNEAKECKMHEPVDYSKYPITYCGLYVNYNPYFDGRV